jgi:hypothetical protein
MMDSACDAESHVELGRDILAALSNLILLISPPFVDHCTGRSHGSIEHVS